MREELNDIFELQTAPRVLVEANAGTGKTYTIVGIFVRLLVERNLEIDQILTVTFTKKATAELRERILERLRDCLVAIEGSEMPEGDDSFLQEFSRRYRYSTEAAGKLRRAIQNFDDSQVFTIHGFCQKILQEEALIAGTPFEMNVSPTDPLLTTAANDFWRVFMHENSGSDAGRYLISKLLSIAQSPDELIGQNGIKLLLNKRYAKPEGEFLDNPKASLQELIDLKSDLKKIWQTDKDHISHIMKNCDVKNYARYIDSRIEKLEHFLADTTFQSDQPDSLRYLTSQYLYNEKNLKKNGDPVPHHPFFEHCSRLSEWAEEVKKVQSTLLMNAYEDISRRRKKLAAESDINSYDDLLINVRDSLLHSQYGSELAEKLKQRYPVALVDEFQDTDPIQYEIFDAIYPGEKTDSSLMMIGDPKQAIYAFRGADLYTYFRAKNDGVGSEYTLMKNYRSTAEYIKAVNSLFEGDRQSFIENEISYPPSKPGREGFNDPLILDGREQPALKVITRKGVESSKKRAGEFVFSQTVQKIGDILDLASKGKAYIGDEPVQAGDIAILISNHKDAKILKRKLKEIGIDAVTRTNQTIFETLEAVKLEILMNAVLNPLNSKSTNALLLTGLFGLDMKEIYMFIENENQYQNLTDELQELQALWYRRGFYAMFYELIHHDERLTNIARLDGAERIITNLYHLAGLCSQEEQDNELAPRSLQRWLQRQMNEAEREEEKELQLESDQHLVKIMTIHASKGLQFPLVFCPTLWLGRKPDFYKNKADQAVEYHKGGENDLFINIERSKTPQRMRAELQSALESAAEEVRKAYVALTRARVGTYVFWDTHSDSIFSGMGASLIGREKLMEVIQANYSIKEGGEISDATFIERFKELKSDSDGATELVLVDTSAGGKSILITGKGRSEVVDLKSYKGRSELKVQKKLESFSSLAGHTLVPGEPDYDQVLERYTEALQPDNPSLEATMLNLFQFPKGATAGTSIHKLFEHEELDFTKIGQVTFLSQIEEVLLEYQFDKKWKNVLQNMMRNVSTATIPGLKLSELKNDEQIREMEFHFPAAGVETSELLDVIRNSSDAGRSTIPSGIFLTGFIDLVARQNGKYYILDYKSNFLGDSFDDYKQSDLQREILANSYDLQYHLYTVALVKYLRTRIPNFDYDQHFGGAVYLFVRGMKAGSNNGIWFHKPEQRVIEQLENLLDRNRKPIV